MKHFLIPALALLTLACQPEFEPTGDEKSDRVLRACGETGRLLGQLKGAESSFRYDEQGHAEIGRSVWTSLPTTMKDGLIKAVAYQAVCASGEPSEQVVTIRAAGTSEVLAQETVRDFDQ